MLCEYLCCICQTGAQIACKCNDKLNYFCNTHFMLHLLNKSVQHSTVALEYNRVEPRSPSSRFDQIFKDLIFYQVEVEDSLNLIADLKHDFFLAISDIFNDFTQPTKTLLTEIHEKKLIIDAFKKNPTAEFERLYSDYKQSGLSALLNFYQQISPVNLAKIFHQLKLKLKLNSEFEDEQVVALKLEKESLLNKLEKTEKILAQRNDRIEAILKESESLKERFSNLHESHEIQEEKIWELEKEISEIKQLLITSELNCNALSSEMQKQQEALNAKLADYKKEINELKDALATMEEKCYLLDKNIEQKTHLLHHYEKTIPELEQEIGKRDLQINSLHDSLNTLNTQLANYTFIIANNESNIQQLQQTVQDRDSSISSLQHSIQTLNLQIQSYENDTIQFKDHITSLQSQLKQDIQTRDLNISTLQDTIHALQSNQSGIISKFNQDLASLQSDIAIKDHLSQELKSQIQSLEEEITSLKLELQQAYADTDNKDEVISNLHELLDHNNKIEELDQGINVLKHKIIQRENTQSSDVSLISEDDPESLNNSADLDEKLKLDNPITQEVVDLNQDSIDEDSKTRESPISSLCSSPNKQHFFEVDSTDSLIEFHQTGEFTGHESAVNCLCITSDNNYIISGGDDNTIRIWNIENMVQVGLLTGHTNSVTCLKVTSDSRYLISCSKDATIRIWNLQTQKIDIVLYCHSQAVNALELVQNDTLIVSGSSDFSVRICCLHERRFKAKIMLDGEVNCLSVVPENDLIAAGCRNGTLSLWSFTHRTPIANLKHGVSVNGVVITENGRLVISGCYDGSVRIWNVGSLECESVLRHASSVYSLIMSGNSLISWSSDCSLKVWNVQSNSCIGNLNCESIHAGEVSRDGKYLAVGTHKGIVLGYIIKD